MTHNEWLWLCIALGLLVTLVIVRAVLATFKARELEASLRGGDGLPGASLLQESLVRRAAQGAEDVRQLLIYAGYRDADALHKFTWIRFGTVLAALFLLLVFVLLGASGFLLFFWGLFLMALALLAPTFLLRARARERQQKVARALPPMIDLIVLSVESGLGLEAAFARVGHEMWALEPVVAEELSTTNSEIAAGVPFARALQRFADRAGVEDLSMVATLVAQATHLGASVAGTFREYIDASRSRRMMMLEEHAGKVSASLTLPLVVCLLPAALVTMIGPAVILVVQSMRQM